MRDDNKYTLDQVGSLLKDLIEDVNTYLKPGKPKLILDGIDLVMPESNNLVDYVGRNKTYQAKFKISYHTESDPEVKTEKILLPILIEGIYVIDGKCKLPLNYMINDQKCLISENKIYLNSEFMIDIKSDQPLKIKSSEGDRKTATYTPVDYEVMDPECLTLDPYSAKKLAILFDLPEIPEVLNEELVGIIVSKFNKRMRDNVLNKTILTPSMAFVRNIRINKLEILREIRGKYYRSFDYKKTKNGKLYLKSLQKYIDSFFLGTDQYFTGIQNPSISNPLIFESMKNKVIFETRITKKTKKSKISYTRFNDTFYGLVDPTQTPDNSNTSRVNELTRCVVIKEGEIYLKCLDPDFNMIEVKYIDYINSKVLKSDQVIYELQEIKPNGELYDVKYRFKVIQSPNFDYIELSPDWRLSISGSQIPMVNLCDSVRVAMGGKMVNQAIGVTGGELPMVTSGNDALETNFTIKSKSAGVVKSVDEGQVIIETPDGEISTYNMPNPINGYNGAQISFKPSVVEGQEVSASDPIIKPDTLSTDNRLKIGINARVAMMSYRGYNFEDGLIISESLAEKFTSVTTQIITVEITPDIVVEGYADVGSRLKSPDKLVTGSSMRKYKGKTKELRSEFNLSNKYTTPWSVKLPNDMPDVLVYDMKIAKGTVPTASDETEYLMSDGRGRQFDRLLDELDLDYEFDRTLLPEFTATEGSSYTMKYKILVFHKLKTQDKVSNRFGSKGVVSLILPDDQMPYDADGNRIECIMNPDAPLSRKNIPQTIELNLTSFIKALKSKHAEMLEDGLLDEIREDFKKYMMYDYYLMSDEEIIAAIKSPQPYHYITKSFSRLNSKILSEWMEELDCTSKIQLWDGVTKRKIRNPIMVSEMYLMKLYFMSNVYAKVTSSSVRGTDELVMGEGSITSKGSKHGNMEIDALNGLNLMEYAKRQKMSEANSSSWFLAHFLITGLLMEVEDE